MLTTALLMGFAGSLHCIGMCSPLAMAVSRFNRAAFVNRVIYNVGRIFTYALMGLVFGLAGEMIPLQNFQNIFSLVLGVCFLLFAFIGMDKVHIPLLSNGLIKLSIALKITFSKFLARRTYFSVLTLGALNGLLPCGLTFLALSYSITLASAWESFYFMLVFGVGTLPAMLGVTLGVSSLVKRLNVNMKNVTVVMFFITGCLLIARVYVHYDFGHHQKETDIVTCGTPS
jgi:sulfite exporter TauE/SafE